MEHILSTAYQHHVELLLPGTLMKIDAYLNPNLTRIPELTSKLEQDGFTGVVTTETSGDPFLPLGVAAIHSEHLELMTGIAVAFARTPMTIAYAAHDLQAASQGRFILGLGSQTRAHIERRFSMPWSEPVARMREFILALRAIWNSWQEYSPLEFEGKFYRHTLMTPFFSPADTRFGSPPIYLAAVGTRMTEVAGEVADGLIVHPFMTESYLRNVMMPALRRGWAKSGRSPQSFEICYPLFMISGNENADLSGVKERIRHQIAFYGSTPEYRGVLESVGMEKLQRKLLLLSKQAKWNEMNKLISDDLLEEFALVSAPSELATQLTKKYGDIVSRTHIDTRLLTASERRKVIQELTSFPSPMFK